MSTSLVSFVESNLLKAAKIVVMPPGTTMPLHTVIVEKIPVRKRTSPATIAAEEIDQAIGRDLAIRKGPQLYMVVAYDTEGGILASQPEVRTGTATVDLSEGALKLAENVLNHSLANVDRILQGAGSFVDLMQTSTGRFHERILRHMDVMGSQNQDLHEQLTRARGNQSTIFDAYLEQRERASRLADPKSDESRTLEKTLEAVQEFGKNVIVPMLPAVSGLIMAWGQKLMAQPPSLSPGEKPEVRPPAPPAMAPPAPAAPAPTTNIGLLRHHVGLVNDAEASQVVAMLMSIHTYGDESESKEVKEARRAKVFGALLGPLRADVQGPIIDLVKRVFQEFLGIQEGIERQNG